MNGSIMIKTPYVYNVLSMEKFRNFSNWKQGNTVDTLPWLQLTKKRYNRMEAIGLSISLLR
ncbi:hypothetical protein HAL_33290 [Haladaptatus sp. T7]|nr:hypothetical protein HAL_33290 [Haladaptatus sp. T7]